MPKAKALPAVVPNRKPRPLQLPLSTSIVNKPDKQPAHSASIVPDRSTQGATSLASAAATPEASRCYALKPITSPTETLPQPRQPGYQPFRPCPAKAQAIGRTLHVRPLLASRRVKQSKQISLTQQPEDTDIMADASPSTCSESTSTSSSSVIPAWLNSLDSGKGTELDPSIAYSRTQYKRDALYVQLLVSHI